MPVEHVKLLVGALSKPTEVSEGTKNLKSKGKKVKELALDEQKSVLAAVATFEAATDRTNGFKLFNEQGHTIPLNKNQFVGKAQATRGPSLEAHNIPVILTYQNDLQKIDRVKINVDGKMGLSASATCMNIFSQSAIYATETRLTTISDGIIKALANDQTSDGWIWDFPSFEYWTAASTLAEWNKENNRITLHFEAKQITTEQLNNLLPLCQSNRRLNFTLKSLPSGEIPEGLTKLSTHMFGLYSTWISGEDFIKLRKLQFAYPNSNEAWTDLGKAREALGEPAILFKDNAPDHLKVVPTVALGCPGLQDAEAAHLHFDKYRNSKKLGGRSSQFHFKL